MKTTKEAAEQALSDMFFTKKQQFGKSKKKKWFLNLNIETFFIIFGIFLLLYSTYSFISHGTSITIIEGLD